MAFEEDDAVRRAFAQHPELEDWAQEDYDRAEIEQGVNWHLHIQMDAVVLRRMDDPSLPDRQVIEALRSRGLSQLEAVHRVADTIARHMWALMCLAGQKRPEELPAELRGRSLPTNEELNEHIRGLLK